MIWEGISDIYREVNAPGGIPNIPFQHFWMNMTGNGLGMTEDHAVASLEHPLFDEYWQSKVVDWSLIAVPVLAVTGWSSLGLHLRGTIEAWKKMSSPNKYLIIHVSLIFSHKSPYHLTEAYLCSLRRPVENGPSFTRTKISTSNAYFGTAT